MLPQVVRSSLNGILHRAEDRPWQVLIAGGGYAGLSAAVNLLDLCAGKAARFAFPPPEPNSSQRTIPVKITIVDERDGYFHTIGAPLALIDKEFSSRAWVRTPDLVGLQHSNVQFLQGSISSLSTEAKEAIVVQSDSKESKIKYDFFIAATGLRRPWPVVPQDLNKSEYLVSAQKHIDSVRAAKDGVVVIGGGAVGIEMAAEIRLVEPSVKVTLIHSRDRLLSSEPLPEDFKSQVLDLIRKEGVNILLEKRVKEVKDDGPGRFTLEFTDGEKMKAGQVLWAISKPEPITKFLPAEVRDEENYVKVSSELNFLASSNPEHHFAVGDIAAFKGIKRCSPAMQMGYHASFNVYQQILVNTFPEDHPKPEYMRFEGIPDGIGLAIGTNGIYWDPEDGIVSGKQALQDMFQDDLGWNKCWNYMQMGKPFEEKAEIST